MFNNPSQNVDTPHCEENNKGDGMRCEHELILNRLDCPITLIPGEATFIDVELHMDMRQRIGPSTRKNYVNYARFMETHKIPIDFRNPTFANFIRHMDYREQVEHAGSYALAMEWQTMQKFLTAYNIPFGIGTEWHYKPPYRQPSKPRKMPTPETVFAMTHHKYCKDEYKNALLQYTLLHSFLIGWRNPSELCSMRLSNVNLDDGTITIIQKKKHNKPHTIAPDKAIMTMNTRKSLKNWIDKWRPTVANQYSGDYLYVRENGKPLNESQYRMFLQRWVVPIFPDFHPYITRHWCAIAKLIQEKLETGHWNEFKVRNWLDHDKIETTMTYLRDAEQYQRIADYNWFKRVLKCPNTEGNTLRIETEPKNHCFDWKYSEKDVKFGLNANVN